MQGRGVVQGEGSYSRITTLGSTVTLLRNFKEADAQSGCIMSLYELGLPVIIC